MSSLRQAWSAGESTLGLWMTSNSSAVAESVADLGFDYVNIDMRELPGVDVVAPIDQLPFDDGTVAEIHSAHVLEHFPQEDLQRRLLPYWRDKLRPGGVPALFSVSAHTLANRTTPWTTFWPLPAAGEPLDVVDLLERVLD